jgi:uncharacterized membrane protein YfcA
MTNPPATPDAVPPVDAAPATVAQRDRNLALISALLLLIGMPVGWLPGSTSDVIGMCVISVIVLALLAGVMLWLVPRERRASHRASRSALILGIVSIVVGGVFWTGLPFAFAPAAIALGLSQRESTPEGQSRGMATAGVALGAFAAVASFVLLLIG